MRRRWDYALIWALYITASMSAYNDQEPQFSYFNGNLFSSVSSPVQFHGPEYGLFSSDLFGDIRESFSNPKDITGWDLSLNHVDQKLETISTPMIDLPPEVVDRDGMLSSPTTSSSDRSYECDSSPRSLPDPDTEDHHSDEIIEDDADLTQSTVLCFLSNDEHDEKLSKRLHNAVANELDVLPLLELDLEFIMELNEARIGNWFDIVLESRLDPSAAGSLQFVEDHLDQVLISFKDYLEDRIQSIMTPSINIRFDHQRLSSIIDRIMAQLESFLTRRPILLQYRKGLLSKQLKKERKSIPVRAQKPRSRLKSSSSPKQIQILKEIHRIESIAITASPSPAKSQRRSKVQAERRLSSSDSTPTIIYDLSMKKRSIWSIVSYFISVLKCTALPSLNDDKRSQAILRPFLRHFGLLCNAFVEYCAQMFTLRVGGFITHHTITCCQKRVPIRPTYIADRKRIAQNWKHRYEIKTGPISTDSNAHLKHLIETVFHGNAVRNPVLYDESVHLLSLAVYRCVADDVNEVFSRLLSQLQSSISKLRTALCANYVVDLDYTFSRCKSSQEFDVMARCLKNLEPFNLAFSEWLACTIGFFLSHYRYLTDRLQFYLDRICSEAGSVEQNSLFIREIEVAASKRAAQLARQHLDFFIQLTTRNHRDFMTELKETRLKRISQAKRPPDTDSAGIRNPSKKRSVRK